MCFFLINKKKPKQKIKDCRQYDSKKDWSARKTDQELLKQFKEDEKIQEKIIEQAQKYNYQIVDVSKNRAEQLEKIYKEIKEKIKNLQIL